MKKSSIIKLVSAIAVLLLLLPAVTHADNGFVICGIEKDDYCTLKDALIMAISILNLSMQLAGIAATIAVIAGAGKIMDAGMYGVSEEYEAGKKTIRHGLVGLALILIAYISANSIMNIFFPATFGPCGTSPWTTPWVVSETNTCPSE